MENGGAAGTEETGVLMGYCVDEETSLDFRKALRLCTCLLSRLD